MNKFWVIWDPKNFSRPTSQRHGVKSGAITEGTEYLKCNPRAAEGVVILEAVAVIQHKTQPIVVRPLRKSKD